jgi:hypothetical protein
VTISTAFLVGRPLRWLPSRVLLCFHFSAQHRLGGHRAHHNEGRSYSANGVKSALAAEGPDAFGAHRRRSGRLTVQVFLQTGDQKVRACASLVRRLGVCVCLLLRSGSLGRLRLTSVSAHC